MFARDVEGGGCAVALRCVAAVGAQAGAGRARDAPESDRRVVRGREHVLA